MGVIVIQDRDAKEREAADYQQKADQAVRSGGPWPEPPRPSAEELALEQDSRLRDPRYGEGPGSPSTLGGASEAPAAARLRERAQDLDRTLPSRWQAGNDLAHLAGIANKVLK